MNSGMQQMPPDGARASLLDRRASEFPSDNISNDNRQDARDFELERHDSMPPRARAMQEVSRARSNSMPMGSQRQNQFQPPQQRQYASVMLPAGSGYGSQPPKLRSSSYAVGGASEGLFPSSWDQAPSFSPQMGRGGAVSFTDPQAARCACV